MMESFISVLSKPDLYTKNILDNGFYDFKDGDNTFNNVCLRDNDEFYNFLVNQYPKYNISLNFVRQSPLGQIEPNYIHTDEMMGELTAILYLNKLHPKDYGTTLYNQNYSIKNIFIAKYNSVFVFESKILHSRNCYENFGEGDDSRLVQVAFLNKK